MYKKDIVLQNTYRKTVLVLQATLFNKISPNSFIIYNVLPIFSEASATLFKLSAYSSVLSFT